METVLMLGFIFSVNIFLGVFFHWAWLEYKDIKKDLK